MTFSIIVAVVLIALAIYYINFAKPKSNFRMTPAAENYLATEVDFYQNLNDKEKERFKQRIQTFLNEVYIQGVQCTITEKDRIMVAASAVIPVFNFQEFHYTNLNTVLIYPGSFNAEMKFGNNDREKYIGGLIGTGRFEKQMIISQKSLRAGFAPTTLGTNTAIHEFVHLIDKMDGATDGVPKILMQHSYAIPWLKLIQHEIRNIEKGKSELRQYGATNDAEFFAVAAEYFFEKPEKLQDEHPKLYQALHQFFKAKS